MDMAESENVLLNIQLPRKIRDEFRIAAKLRGQTMSSLLYQHILQTVRQEKDVSPQAFPDYVHEEKNVPARSIDRYREYAETFDAEDLSETEWQFLELYFRDKVMQWQRAKAEREQGPSPSKVVARIDPGSKPEREITREEVFRMITGDEIDEIKRRVTPRKKKAG